MAVPGPIADAISPTAIGSVGSDQCRGEPRRLDAAGAPLTAAVGRLLQGHEHRLDPRSLAVAINH